MPWPTKKLGEACEIISPGIKEFECSKKYVATADVDCDKITNFTEITYKNRPIRANIEVKENDILVARMAETKKFLMADKNLQNNYIFSTGFAALRVKEELIPKYLFYFLTTKDFNLQKDKLAVGATQKAINNPALKKIKIPIPPLKIQQKIVKRLDEIKKAQELNDKQIELAEELFQSLLHRELDPKGKNWEVKKLGDVCEIARGGSPRPINKYLTKSSDGINWIKIGDVKEGEKYITSTAEKIKPEGISKTRLVQEGDLILSNSMSFGRPYILKISGAIHDGWLLLHINNANEILQDFLYYILGTTQTKIQFEKFASGGVVKNLNSDLVRRVKIPLPPLETQQKIVEKLSAVQEYKKKLLDQKQKLQELFESVLNKSFKGELVG